MFIGSISFVISNSSSGKLALTSIGFKSVPFLFVTLTAFLVLALSPGMAHTSNQCEELQCHTKYTDTRKPDLDSYPSSVTQRLQHWGNCFCSLYCHVLNWKHSLLSLGLGHACGLFSGSEEEQDMVDSSTLVSTNHKRGLPKYSFST